MIRAQSGPDSRYLHVVTSRPKIARRSRWASNLETASLDISSPLSAEEERIGSVPKALLIGIPISALLWAVIIWAAVRLF